MESMIALTFGLVLGGIACWLIQGARASSHLAKRESEHQITVAGLQGQLQQVESTKEILDSAKTQLSEAFQATATTALQQNNELFMHAAKGNLDTALESAKGEFKQRHEQFEALVKPLAQNYEKLNPQIESLILQNQSLVAETGKLSNALTNNRQIGSWGEIQLRRVVELAGMTQYCDFAEQSSITGSSERPDLTVKLPDKRAVVVDAKASTEAYLEAQNAPDDAGRDNALRRHASALRTQVDSLSGKGYGALVEGSLDFVIMFVPGDQFLAAALNANPGLVEYAMAKRVAIATPASLVSLLWAVANGWQRQQIAHDAEEIRKVGEDMHQRLQTFITHYQKVGRELKSAVEAFNSSVGSYDNRVAPQGRRFTQLLGRDESSFPSLAAIEAPVNVSRYAERASDSPTDSD